MDTGTPRKYLPIAPRSAQRQTRGYTFDTDVMIGKRCKIHPSVKYKGKVIVGDGCKIESGVKRPDRWSSARSATSARTLN